jgi:hypothetical protein
MTTVRYHYILPWLFGLLISVVASSASAVQITVIVTDTLDNGIPVESRSDTFDCNSQIFAAIYLNDVEKGPHQLVIDWTDPNGRRRERSTQQANDTTMQIVTWLKMHAAPGSGILRAFNRAIGMTDFIGTWTVSVSVDGAKALHTKFDVMC